MNITQSELKEIAKAGYGNCKTSEFIEYSYMSVGNCLYSLYIDGMQMDLFTLEYRKGYVEFISDSPFNHLAAIRKMEELGLIER